MIILDTNVVSELMRPAPNKVVSAWVGERRSSSLFISAITEAELRYGAAILPKGKRRAALQDAVDKLISIEFRGRVLPFDQDAACAYAEIAAMRRQKGKAISQLDCQIASIVKCRGAAVATRNVTDFAHTGIDVIDPWAA